MTHRGAIKVKKVTGGVATLTVLTHEWLYGREPIVVVRDPQTGSLRNVYRVSLDTGGEEVVGVEARLTVPLRGGRPAHLELYPHDASVIELAKGPLEEKLLDECSVAPIQTGYRHAAD